MTKEYKSTGKYNFIDLRTKQEIAPADVRKRLEAEFKKGYRAQLNWKKQKWSATIRMKLGNVGLAFDNVSLAVIADALVTHIEIHDTADRVPVEVDEPDITSDRFWSDLVNDLDEES